MKIKHDLSKSFVVNSICREDLLEYTTKKTAEQLDDNIMAYIARKMADAMQDSYWVALDEVIKNLKY